MMLYILYTAPEIPVQLYARDGKLFLRTSYQTFHFWLFLRKRTNRKKYLLDLFNRPEPAFALHYTHRPTFAS